MTDELAYEPKKIRSSQGRRSRSRTSVALSPGTASEEATETSKLGRSSDPGGPKDGYRNGRRGKRPKGERYRHAGDGRRDGVLLFCGV